MPESLQDLRASFNRSLRVEGKSDRTIVLYGQSISSFVAWLTELGVADDVDQLTREHVLGWLDSLRRRGLTAATVGTRWRGLRRFTNWLVAEDIIRKAPLDGISVARPDPPTVPVFTDDELAALLDACKGRGFIDLRDAAIVRLLMDCGLRVSELTGIDLKDLDLDGEAVQVTGKGSRVRMAYFASKTVLALDRYLRTRKGHRHAADPALFLGERGRLSADGVRDRMKVIADRAGLDPKTVHPHRFRHTNAHDFLLAGGQERDLMRLLGWRSEAMLSRYGASAADHRAMQAAKRLRRGDRI